MILYARYTDLLTGDTLSAPAGVEDPLYPRANAIDLVSHTVARFTGTTGTLRRTFAGTVTPEAAIFVNTDATAIQLTNDAGLNLAVTIPSEPEDGLHLDPWIDLRGLANVTAAQWNAALTGPAGVGLGEFLLVGTLRTLYALWTPIPSEDESHPVVHHETDYGVDLDFGFGVRVRGGVLTAREEDGRTAFLSLERAQRGRLRPWVLIPNHALNDALFVKFASDQMSIGPVGGSPTIANAYVSDVSFMVKEQQKGLALS